MINKVFVNSPERSGSNFLCKLLQDELNYYYVPPIHFFKYIKTLIEAPTEGWNSIHGRLLERLEFFGLQEEAEMFRAFIKKDNLSVPEIIHFYLNSMFQETSGRIPIFKENDLVSYFPLILDALSDAAIVSQLRDPRMMWKSSKDIRPGFLKSKFGSLNETIRMWSNADKHISFLSVLDNSELTYFVRYEDLVADRDKALEALRALPKQATAYDQEKNAAKMRKIASSSPARKNLTSGKFNARTYENSQKRFSLADMHIAYQLHEAMLKRGYSNTKPSRLVGILLSLVFMLLEPLERICNRALDVKSKDGSRVLYAGN